MVRFRSSQCKQFFRGFDDNDNYNDDDDNGDDDDGGSDAETIRHTLRKKFYLNHNIFTESH